MLMAQEDSIRDVIAFPKVKDASCLMTEAPGQVDDKQLEELFLAVDLPEKEEKTEEQKIDKRQYPGTASFFIMILYKNGKYDKLQKVCAVNQERKEEYVQ